jgi:hypothetical protein
MPWEQLDQDRNFSPAEPHSSSASAMLEEMGKWAQALKTMR